MIVRFDRMMRGASLAAVAWAGAAGAQNTQAPVIITPPSQTYSLPTQEPTPSATPTPAPTPTPTLIPSPTTVPTASPSAAPPPVTRTVPAAPTSTPTPRAMPAREPTTTPSPRPTSTSPATAPATPETLTPAPQATSAPEPPATEAPAVEADEPRRVPAWLLAVGGALIAAGAAGLWWRRRRPADAAPDAMEEPARPAEPVSQPSPPARPLAVASAPTPEAATADGLVVQFTPVSLYADSAQTVLAFEMAVANGGAHRIEAIRPTVAITTAHPAIADHVAGFGDTVPMSGSGDSFDLAPGEARRISGELNLPREAMHVSAIAGRPMTVPVAIVHLRWRSGLTVRSHVEAHMVGTGDGAAKLGPLWLDRPRTQTRRLASRRL